MKKLIILMITIIVTSILHANEINVSKRMNISYENSGDIVFNNEYMTNYIARFVDSNGDIGLPLFIEPNTKKVDFDVVDAEIEGYALKVDGKWPQFNTVSTERNILTGYATSDSSGPYDIYISGGGLLSLLTAVNSPSGADMLMLEDELNEDTKIAFILNMLTFTEHTVTLIDNVSLSKNNAKKVESIKELFETIQDIKNVASKISTYYAMSKVIVQQIQDIAEYTGGMTNGVPNNELLAFTFGLYNNSIQLIDNLVAKSDKFAAMVSNLEQETKWEEEFNKASKKRLEEVYNIVVDDYHTAISDAYQELNGEENDVLAFVEDVVLEPARKMLKTYISVLKQDYKDAEGAAKEDLKLEIKMLSGTRGVLQLYSVFFDSTRLYSIMKDDPEQGRELITTMSFDIAEAVTANYLLDFENISAEIIFKKYGVAAIEKASIYYKAFNGSKHVANVLLPFLSDFALSPIRLRASIIEGELSQLESLKSKIEVSSNGDTQIFESLSNDEEIKVFVEDDQLINFNLHLVRPDYFEPTKSPWKLNGSFNPQTIYDAAIHFDSNTAFSRLLCVKKNVGNEEYASYMLGTINTHALSGRCDAGEWGVIDGKWFSGDIANSQDNYQLYDSENDISPVLKLDDTNLPLIQSTFLLDDVENPVLVLVNGYDLITNFWEFNFYPKLLTSDVTVKTTEVIANDDGFLNKFTVTTNFGTSSEWINLYRWDFGDGSEIIDTEESTIEHQYSETGTYTIKVTLITEQGQELVVEHSTVAAAFGVQFQTGTDISGLERIFTVTVNPDDPIYLTFWDWDDNSSTSTGNRPTNTSYTEAVSHVYAQAGTYTVTVSVTTVSGVVYTLMLEIDAQVDDSIVATNSLNDTGITTCSDYAFDTGSGIDDNGLDCNQTTDADGDPIPSGQDGHSGRDVTHNDDSDGHGGFSFTKLDTDGSPLDASATDWSCVKDNVTGLIWEVKTTDGGLQDKGNTYSWYNSTGSNDGGLAGTTNGGSCYDSVNCDTEKYVAAVNAVGLCGATDWLLPTKEQLRSIVDYSIYLGQAIDTSFFPNIASYSYWSSSSYANYSNYAWYVHFYNGNNNASNKASNYRVRLVRAGQ